MSRRAFPTTGSTLRRRGIALVLVVTVMALAAILGYAMLSASALQATASTNSIELAIAQSQAESGIHLAIYYLMNPKFAPAPPTLPYYYWPGANNITFATTGASPTTMPGSVSVAVTPLGSNDFQIVSTGSSGTTNGGDGVTRSITATVQIPSFQIVQAGGFNSSVTIRSGITFAGSPNAISSSSAVAISVGGTVIGNIIAPSPPSGSFTGSYVAGPTEAPAPNYETETDYTQGYTYQGAVYYPVQLPSTINSTTIESPSMDNPLGIFYTSGGLTVKSPLTVSGTLIVKGGTLLNESNISITTQSNNLPALVVDNALEMDGNGKTLTATGVVYAGEGITGLLTGALTTITINGAFLNSTAGIASSYAGKMTVNYNSTYTSIPNLSTTNLSSTGPEILSWTE